MIIATFNVNSVRAHIQNILEWIKKSSPDVIMMQELKCETQAFPYLEFEDLGYTCKVVGQKAYNGVAILSKYSIEDVTTSLPDFDPQNARYIDALIDGRLRVVNVYVPNGNPVPSEKFDYKIKWHQKLNERVSELVKNDEIFIIGGDFNVARGDREIYNPKAFADDAITQPESRHEFENLIKLGLTDSLRIYEADNDKAYTYWGYRGGCWSKGMGILLDYFLVNKRALENIENVWIDSEPRGWESPSDHTPLILEIK